ncbi:hypothetical protein SAMN05421832_109172 [Psychrobacillus psychrodurans]|nr:hypothetical protein SAMN05421832_109172 [Psychrobacillus psychrodurans]
MDFSELVIETERLIIRPFKKDDYSDWFKQFDNRMPSKYKYDDARPSSMSAYTEEWFVDWINGFNESARKDKMYNLGIFR